MRIHFKQLGGHEPEPAPHTGFATRRSAALQRRRGGPCAAGRASLWRLAVAKLPWLAAIGAGILLSACACLAFDCFDELTVSGPFPYAASSAMSLDVVACRNDSCSAATLVPELRHADDLQYGSGGLIGTAGASWELRGADFGGSLQLVITFHPADAAGDFEDGDVIIVQAIDSASGALVVDVATEVTYDDVYGCTPHENPAALHAGRGHVLARLITATGRCNPARGPSWGVLADPPIVAARVQLADIGDFSAHEPRAGQQRRTALATTTRMAPTCLDHPCCLP